MVSPKSNLHAPNLLASIIYLGYTTLRMGTQILAELYLLASKFTPGFDQTQKYFKFYSRKYFKISCHANANFIYLGVFLFLDYKLDAESGFRLYDNVVIFSLLTLIMLVGTEAEVIGVELGCTAPQHFSGHMECSQLS